MPLTCEIRVKGHLNESWAVWFEGLDVFNAEDGHALMRGSVPDQTALFGLLAKIRDLGLPLVSLCLVDPDVEDQPAAEAG